MLKAADRSHKPCLWLDMKMSTQPASNTFPGHTLTALWREFSVSSLSNVNFFELRITHTLHEVPGLTQFMACLPSVEIIVMEEPMLCHLGTYAPPKGSGAAVKVLFPALKTLALGSFTPSSRRKI